MKNSNYNTQYNTDEHSPIQRNQSMKNNLHFSLSPRKFQLPSQSGSLTSRTNSSLQLRHTINSRIKAILSKSHSDTYLPFSIPKKQLSPNERTSIKMSNKVQSGIRENYFKLFPPSDIKEKTFRKKLIRDYKGANRNFNIEEFIEGSKNKYEELSDVMRQKKQMEIKKSIMLICNFEKRKQSSLPTFEFNLKCINNNNKENNKTKKKIKVKGALDEYYKYKKQKQIKRSEQISKELLHINCGEYEPVRKKNGELKCTTRIVSQKNLNRKIKLYNIENFCFDYEDDVLCEKNAPLLKELLKSCEVDVLRKTSNFKPKFLKPKLRNNTIRKFSGLCGNFFGGK